MTNSDLHYLGAIEALKLFKAKQLSPVELMDAILERAEQVTPDINAFSQTFFDEARDQARKAEDRYVAGKPTRPLEGLALAIKDEETGIARR